MIAIIVVSIFALIFLTISWVTHLSMVGGCHQDFGWGSFKDFKREYNKRSWERDTTHRMSHFGVANCSSKNYIHAGIIRFNDVGLKLDFISHTLFTVWVIKNRLKRGNMRFNNITPDGDC